MSMNSYPIKDIGLLLAREVAAHVMLYVDRRDGTLPKNVESAVKTGRFDDMAKGSGLPDYYYDAVVAKEALDEMGIDPVYCSEFDGTATPLLGNDGETSFCGTYMAYVPAKNGPDLFRQAYGNPEELVAEFRQVFEDILPEGFDVERHIVRVEGTYVA